MVMAEEMEGRAELRAMLHTPALWPASAVGMAKFTVVRAVLVSVSDKAARRLHSTAPVSLAWPVSQ